MIWIYRMSEWKAVDWKTLQVLCEVEGWLEDFKNACTATSLELRHAKVNCIERGSKRNL